MFVGLAFVALIVVALLNLLERRGHRHRRSSRGLPLAGFAVPDALARRRSMPTPTSPRTTARAPATPAPKATGGPPPARSTAPGAIRVCDLFDKPLAISFWFTRGGDCVPSQDAFDEVAARYRGRVNFLSIDVRDDPGTVADIVREHGWKVPVGLDRDGAVSNLYRVGVCPTIVLAYPGGIVHDTAIRAGNYDAGEISGLVDDLLAATRRREAEVR